MRGNVRQRGEGTWRIQVYAGIGPDNTERRVSRTVKAPHTREGRKVAERELARLIIETDASRNRMSDGMVLGELLERWVRAREADWSPATTRNHRWRIGARILDGLGQVPIDQLRPIDLDQFYAGLRADGLEAATIRKYHQTIRTALSQAVKWGLLDVNPADRATPPQVPKPKVEAATADQVRRVLAHVGDDPAFFAFLALAATTGARRSQLCALRWDDLDVEAGTVTFSGAIVDAGGGVTHRQTKTGTTYTVAVGAQALETVERWRQVCPQPTGYVFSRRGDGHDPWRPDSVSRRWRKLRAKAGVGTLKLHALRHGVATRLLGAGVDVRTVAGRLGHANPNVTLSTYAHFLPEKDREAADLLDGEL